MEYQITKEIKNILKKFHTEHFSKENCAGRIWFELFEQKYGRVPELVEVWENDEELNIEAERIIDESYN